MTGTLTGADPDQLDDLAREFAQAARRLREIQSRVDGRVVRAPWAGMRADRFRTGWRGGHGPAVSAAVAQLERAAVVVADNAADQRRTSAAGTGGSQAGHPHPTDWASGLAGPFVIGKSLKDVWKQFGKSKLYAQFLSNTLGQLRNAPGAARFMTAATAAEADALAFARWVSHGNAAGKAMQEFIHGKPGGLLARLPGGAALKTVLGKAALPLTVATGLMDAVTGGGYEGPRDWTTRALGLGGAAGAGALLLAGAGIITLGPIGLAVAGGALVAYGAWSVGNYVYDNWGEISEFSSKAWDWTTQTAGTVWDSSTEALSEAKDWAGDRLDDAVDTVQDVGRSTLKTLSLGLL